MSALELASVVLGVIGVSCAFGGVVALIAALRPRRHDAAPYFPSPLGRRGSEWPERPRWHHPAAAHDLVWRSGRDDGDEGEP